MRPGWCPGPPPWPSAHSVSAASWLEFIPLGRQPSSIRSKRCAGNRRTKMLRDLFSQAYEAMLYNRRRTLITTIGMAWGIATVVLLMAYGAGFGRAIEAIFAQFGTNIMGVFPGTTSQQAGGKKAGVSVRFQIADVDLIAASVPGLLHISPEVSKDVTVQNDTHSYTWSVSGSYPAMADVHKLAIDYGRFFTEKD